MWTMLGYILESQFMSMNISKKDLLKSKSFFMRYLNEVGRKLGFSQYFIRLKLKEYLNEVGRKR